MKKISNLLTIILIILASYSYGQKPKNLEECNIYFDKHLKTKDIKYIKNLAADETYKLHFSLGLYIRNNWIYGERDPELVKFLIDAGLHAPDDMSGIIIKNYWHHLNNTPFDLQGEIDYYNNYWTKIAEAQKSMDHNISKTREYFGKIFININYKNVEAPVLKIPQYKTMNSIFCNEFIKYKDGYIINSLNTSPDGGGKVETTYRYHYIDLKTNIIYKLDFAGFDTVESVIAMDSALYVAGYNNGKLKVIRFENGKIMLIENAVLDDRIQALSHEDWIKLGVFNDKLFALQPKGLFELEDNVWHVKNRFDMKSYFHKRLIIPTENIKLTKNKLYFLQEILQGRDCELFELNLKTDSVVEFFNNHSLSFKCKTDVSTYSIIGDDSAFLAAEYCQKSFLLSEISDSLSLYLLDNRLNSYQGDSYIRLRKVVKFDGKLLFIADNGLFCYYNHEITPIAFFENYNQIITGHRLQLDIIPRSCAILGENKFLIGGQFGGLLLIDLKQNTIQTLDDKKAIPMDLLKE